MSDHLRVPFAQSMDAAIYARIQKTINRLGYALPCTITAVNGPIVTVQIDVQDGVHTFPPVKCPVSNSKYVREPYQVGDTGCVFPVGVYVGGVSGLGGGNANGVEQGNLSTMMFFPTGSTGYTSADPNKVVMLGPGGAQTGQIGGTAQIIHDSNGITITGGNILITGGNVTVDGPITLKDHIHSDVTVGTSQSGPPVPGH